LEVYPQRCNNKPTPESDCNKILVNDNGKPLKMFLYHGFPNYLASLLADPALEMAMDDAHPMSKTVVDDTLDQPSTNNAPKLTPNCTPLCNSQNVKGPFGTSFLKAFCGPRDNLYCINSPEGRYVFQLCVDFFAVKGMTTKGTNTLCGIIALACLNLPVDICYKLENMYLAGIIPGTKEPTLTAINYYTQPLIDDMLRAWKDSIFITQTALRPKGQLTRSIIASIVCDLPAVRKTTSLALSGAKIFCNTCNCWHKLDACGEIIKDWCRLLCCTDFKDWGKHDVAEMHHAAEQWCDASTVKEQEKIFSCYGVRWSKLWRLPYWDPTSQLVVDSMHCLFLGLAKFHFTDILRLSTAYAEKTGSAPAFSWQFDVPDVADKDATVDGDTPDANIPLDDNKWKPNQIRHVITIHKLLLTPLCGVYHEEGNKGASANALTLDQLEDHLTKRLTVSLNFIANNLGLEVKPSGTRRMLTKADLATALVEWVS
jgi:hypothetical protein